MSFWGVHKLQYITSITTSYEQVYTDMIDSAPLILIGAIISKMVSY